MKIIGLDLSFRRSCACIIGNDGSIDFSCRSFPPKKKDQDEIIYDLERLISISEWIDQLIDCEKPDMIAMEQIKLSPMKKTWIGRNGIQRKKYVLSPSSPKLAGLKYHVAVVIFSKIGIPPEFIFPNTARKEVLGRDIRDKKEIISEVLKITKLYDLNDDQADAWVIAEYQRRKLLIGGNNHETSD